ncbi:hypothetical protein NDU88_012358 [Pleurodeles waltl]|uniref:Uncharacterized protein n=1 Tax=Pleurodeles waltl TaxID=8319 RepID=A0AAV7QZW2_PLEWA|nr:hypothetical protein NDU88_012358 [Pleurodeles waltl]
MFSVSRQSEKCLNISVCGTPMDSQEVEMTGQDSNSFAGVFQESGIIAKRRRNSRVRNKQDHSLEADLVTRRKQSHLDCTVRRVTTNSKDPADTLKGAAFCCDLCKSPYIVNPGRRGNCVKTSSSQPSPRHRRDPKTGQVLLLCNACGLSFGKPVKAKGTVKEAMPNDRKEHEAQMQNFALAMVELLGDQDAANLCCPSYNKKPCLCLQNYLKTPGLTNEECPGRAVELLHLFKEARRLKGQKFSCEVEDQPSGSAKRKGSGLGNGCRRSKAYEEFVLKNRKELRQGPQICEKAVQRILGYSNNFLHKKLKTSPQKRERVERTKGRGAMGLLKPIAELSTLKCCMDHCSVMAHSYSRLIQQWRERASRGQAEARRVLAEMLTPSGGSRCNCYRFISWVTGCSHTTISKVSQQMKRTGGLREPPPHKLKRQTKAIQGQPADLQLDPAEPPTPPGHASPQSDSAAPPHHLSSDPSLITSQQA